MANNVRIAVTGMDEVMRELNRWGLAHPSRIAEACRTRVVPMLVNYAKENRPWTDRTGNARRGLHGKVIESRSDISVQLHHGVPYGIFLELCHSGKYAILVPTLEANKTEIARILRSV